MRAQRWEGGIVQRPRARQRRRNVRRDNLADERIVELKQRRRGRLVGERPEKRRFPPHHRRVRARRGREAAAESAVKLVKLTHVECAAERRADRVPERTRAARDR